jgi:sirohydrochlorin cobaltochelatase
MLWEGFGFGWAETAYSGVTFPLVEPALDHCARLGYRRIVVFPYFLFTGILVQRIYDATDRVARRYPGIQFVKAPYLNDHPLVVETFAERITQVLTGDTAMNCALCKYRTQVLGFEDEVGLPQASHHHHVEGIGTGHGHGDGNGHHHPHHHHDHDHHHIHGHEHAHGHHPYPHADHPLGPRTLRKR